MGAYQKLKIHYNLIYKHLTFYSLKKNLFTNEWKLKYFFLFHYPFSKVSSHELRSVRKKSGSFEIKQTRLTSKTPSNKRFKVHIHPFCFCWKFNQLKWINNLTKQDIKVIVYAMESFFFYFLFKVEKFIIKKSNWMEKIKALYIYNSFKILFKLFLKYKQYTYLFIHIYINVQIKCTQ